MQTLWQDVRYSFRTLVKKPTFTVIALVTLIVGIGTTTAIFSIVNGVLLRPLPYADEARVVTLWQNNIKSGVEREETSPATFADWRARTQAFEDLAMAEPFGFTLIDYGEPETIRGWVVSEGFFDILAITPLHGRTFAAEEYLDGNDQVVVLGYGLWQRRFGGDPTIIGHQYVLNGQPHTIIGVMPKDFQYPPDREIWVPRPPRERDSQIRAASYIRVVARLKSGYTLAQAQAEMNNVAAQLEEQYPQSNAGVGAVVVPIREYMVGHVRTALLILFGAVSLVLLIVCANLANLFLVRAIERVREFSIRAALGAGRGRLLRQVLTEGMILALLGGVGGVLLASWLIELILALSPGNLPRLSQITLSSGVLLFALGVSLLTALAFGVVPALQASRPNLQEALKEGGRASTTGRGRARFRNLLVVGEVALALVLVVSAGLLVRSFITLMKVDPGFSTENALALEVQLGRRPAAQRAAFFDQTFESLRTLPGVQGVAATSSLPFHDNQVTIPVAVTLTDRPSGASGTEPTAYRITVTSDYLQTLGVPLVSGRYFTPFDQSDSALVIIINQSLAKRHWPSEDPLGRKISFATPGGTITAEIVGVVADVLPSGFDSQARPEIYSPYAQSLAGGMTFLVRTSVEPNGLLAAVKEKIREVSKNQTFSSTYTLSQLVDKSIAARRFNLFLLSAFAMLALLLAGVGLYGLISYSTAQRTHEIGVRLALGAQRRDIFRLIIWQGMKLVLIGTGIGLATALGLTRLLKNLLFKVSVTDPLTFAAIALLLTGVGLLACYLPARRAMKTDPMTALRYE